MSEEMSEPNRPVVITRDDQPGTILHLYPGDTLHIAAPDYVALRAELEALRRDAARLDFVDHITVDYQEGASWIGGNVCKTIWGNSLREIIDAAIAGETK